MIFSIRDIRIEKKITLVTLSATTGYSISYLSELERNKVSNPTFAPIEKIAAALNVCFKDLLICDCPKCRR